MGAPPTSGVGQLGPVANPVGQLAEKASCSNFYYPTRRKRSSGAAPGVACRAERRRGVRICLPRLVGTRCASPHPDITLLPALKYPKQVQAVHLRRIQK